MSYLLDTNIVSYFLRRNANVRNKLNDVTRHGSEVFISCITYYEVKRGLLAVDATRQIAEFNQFCRDYEVLFLDDIEIFDRACEIHMDVQSRGLSLEDADIFIAATAITRGLILVSNDSDLQRVQGISLENWLEAEL